MVEGALTHDTIVLCLRDLRTLIGQWIKGVTNFELLGMCDKCLDKLMIGPSLDVDAGPSAAALTMIETRKGEYIFNNKSVSLLDTMGSPFDRLVNICVVEDD